MAVTAFNYSIQEAETGGSLLSSKHNEFQKEPKKLSISKERQKTKPTQKDLILSFTTALK